MKEEVAVGESWGKAKDIWRSEAFGGLKTWITRSRWDIGFKGAWRGMCSKGNLPHFSPPSGTVLLLYSRD